MEQEYLNEKIGGKIRNLRNQLGLTQQELADRTELTKGFISQLERGQVTPSVITLLDLIECLGTTPADFFKEDEEERVVYSEEGFFEKIDEQGNSIQWIVPSAQNNMMEPLLVELKPHQSLEEDKPHDGEEFGYVIAGRIRLHLGDRIFEVKAGESFYFEAKKSHRIENPGGRSAEFIWVSTPPTF
ncbi:MAG: XRE family transcriptional regulator [Lachnospiraceae bacterium]|nr:XRE family transcriptional regulator [Lachnospiraceae bacterium]